MRYSVTPRGRRDERGAAAIMVAISMVMVTVAAALVLDFGAVRLDRQMNKVAADTAASAGVHGLDRGDGEPHPFAGVCQALTYLRESQKEFSGLPTAGGNVNCPANPAKLRTVCKPGVAGSHASYTATTGGLTVTIKSPYSLTDGGFVEENLTTRQSDTGEPSQAGCDQLGVIITETRSAGLGSMVTSDDIGSSVRSVGRVTVGDEGDGAVAMLLLEREECEVLRNASNNTRIVVQGNGDVPGLIHSDSVGSTGCSSTKLFRSGITDGIVAEESVNSPKLPGVISARALRPGEPGANPASAQDLYPEVVAKPNPGGAVAGRLVTRSVIDEKYLGPVDTLRQTANALLSSPTAPAGWQTVGCNPTAVQQLLAGRIWVNCSNFNGSALFANATEAVFTGRVSGDVSLPQATRVYIEGSASPAGLTVSTFKMHHFGALSCPSGTVASRAALVIRQGQLTNQNSSSQLQLCNTAVVLLGDAAGTGCLPTTVAQAYTTNSCNGLLRMTGGTVRWTAPDAIGQAERSDADFAALEDLALWTEASGQSHNLSGNLYMAGVFMVPNAKPFNITGSGVMQVADSQYIVDKLDVTGSGTLTMKPDPYDSIRIPIIDSFGLVR